MEEPSVSWKVVKIADRILSDKVVSTIAWLLVAIVFSAGLIYITKRL
jgi:hypothetical protein